MSKIFTQVLDWLDKCERQLRQRLFKLRMVATGELRPSSYPYISGDSFRSLAEHIHDETGSFNPEDVKTADIVFVGQNYILEYLSTTHKRIQNKYILISHNSDSPIDKKVQLLLDDKIISLFSQNVDIEDPRIIPIPIGLENLHIHINGITSFYNKTIGRVINKKKNKKSEVLYGFSTNTNPEERGLAKKYLKSYPNASTPSRFIAPKRHLALLATYCFVASPPGNGIDCCRTWEALYVRTIPIVKDSITTRYFKSLGLPLLIVKNWTELSNYDKKALRNKYNELTQNAKWDALYMDFWINKIEQTKKLNK